MNEETREFYESLITLLMKTYGKTLTIAVRKDCDALTAFVFLPQRHMLIATKEEYLTEYERDLVKIIDGNLAQHTLISEAAMIQDILGDVELDGGGE